MLNVLIAVLMGVLMILAGFHTAGLISEIPDATCIMKFDIIVAIIVAILMVIIVAIAEICVIINRLYISDDIERKLISESKEMSSEEVSGGTYEADVEK